MRSLLRLLVASVCLVACAPAQSRATKTTVTPSSKAAVQAVRGAVWNDLVEKAIGMTKEDFETLGLARLTPGQFAQFVRWASQAEQKAVDDAKASAPNLGCFSRAALPNPGPAGLDKVTVFLDAQGEEAAEIVSGLRKRLRSISDVEVVFSEEDADVAVGLIAVQPLSENGDLGGYTLSVVTWEPCEVKVGTNRYPEKKLNNFYLHVLGSNAQDAVESAVSVLDAHDFEEKRKFHASIKALRQQGSKPQP
jgi:hypothetical protein